jgi:hypothetical protein
MNDKIQISMKLQNQVLTIKNYNQKLKYRKIIIQC